MAAIKVTDEMVLCYTMAVIGPGNLMDAERIHAGLQAVFDYLDAKYAVEEGERPALLKEQAE